MFTSDISDPNPFSFRIPKAFHLISSLHARHRMDNGYCTAMRDTCMAVYEHVKKFGYRPLPSAVVAQFVNAKDMRHLLHLAQFRIGKMMSYNFDGINRAEFGSRPKEGEKEQGRGVTIEFRQHAGTLDGQAICMWVRTLAGFVKFIEEVSPESFVDFIGTIMEAELWEKEHDGKDAEREAKYGPIPADGPFTIIDLLQHIGLEKEAEYYKDKWVIHEG